VKTVPEGASVYLLPAVVFQLVVSRTRCHAAGTPHGGEGADADHDKQDYEDATSLEWTKATIKRLV
jgi:hypothetical protein